MGTRSRIGILEPDGLVTSVYCQWDGYLAHHGPILFESYKTEKKVRALMALGDLSVLGRKIGNKHDFETREFDACTAYGRDRGENDVAARHTSLEEFVKEHLYAYLFLPANSTWLFINNGKIMPLHEALTSKTDEDDV